MKSTALTLSLLAAASAAVAIPSQAQRVLNPASEAAWSIVIFDQPNYAGNSANFTNSSSNLGPQWRRSARSINVSGGSWLVCEDPNFAGRCVTLTESAPDLASYNLRRVGSVRPVRETVTYRKPRNWSITVYRNKNYRDSPRRLTAAVSNLTIPVRSVTIGRGSWELCAGRNYTGDCVTLDQSVPDLTTEGFSGYVRSIRPAANGRR